MRYIGSKFKLINYISNTVKKYCGENISELIFCDLFSGTGVVGKNFSPIVKYVIANDLEYYSYIANSCVLKGFDENTVNKIISHCNEIEPKYYGDIFDSYAEGGKCGRMYFTKENGGKLESARYYLSLIKDIISEDDYNAVLYSLISAADKIANTASTYGAFLKEFNPSAKKQIIFETPDFAKGCLSNNKVYNDDANNLIKQIKGDILYIDPPYNTRQYSAYYHVLNGIATYKIPFTESKTGVCKSQYNKSEYSIEKSASIQLEDLIKNADFEWIFMSYNNEGIISLEEIKSIMEKYGTYYIEQQEHQRYKADKKRKYVADKTIEYIHVLHKVKKNNIEQLTLFHNDIDNKNVDRIIISPMNYTGGKKKLVKQIKEFLPENINTFVDLFCGGCTIGINVNAKHTIFNDTISPLIDLYKSFQKHSPEYIIKYVEKQIDKFNLSLTNKYGYEKLRDFYNKHKKPLDLFVLIMYSFNHMLRFNSDGNYNIPFGENRSQYNGKIKSNIENFVGEIRNRSMSFVNNDFREFPFDSLSENDFVYCDPPYFVSTASYNDGWTENEEQSLLAILDDLNNRGIKFALSNVLTNKGQENTILSEWVKNNNYKIIHLNMSYSNSSYHRKERNDISDEVLIINY